MRKVQAIALAALAVGCTPVAEPEREPPEVSAEAEVPEPLPRLASQQDNAQLALLDHMLARHFEEAPEDISATCVSVNDGRSGEALPMAEETALMERHPQLAPLIRCTLDKGRWTDAESGELASMVTLHGFTCASTASCTGWASAQTGGAASPSWRYTMEWDEGAWRFTRNPRLIADS